jgi:pyrimidine operon attenuation protein / uracil phosphoribosyltransferase
VKTQINHSELLAIIDQLADQLLLAYPDIAHTVLVGIQQGGVVVSNLLYQALQKKSKGQTFGHGQLDITFYRDDVRNKILAPDTMHLPFDVEGKTVILVDDVLFTGRTIKAALDALFDYGRPDRVKLCVLVDRPEHRQFPIQADHVGQVIKAQRNDKLKLRVNEQGQAELLLLSE